MVPSPSATKHNTVLFDVNFQEGHLSVYSYSAHFFLVQGQLQSFAFKLFLMHIPGMFFYGAEEAGTEGSDFCSVL